ncbi:alpha/beta fold hydrolase [Sphingomonas sp. HF-S4]|uniref:Alpha/beta fold hydrolase n=1 Tax=Sphingomonas agrestis TaxID=3080540 RepID=A0ABU3Y752_9SPHN|nr:alpha/beta fold hydrolase [Sphingomonas sp. HF-S4]MDV3457194.1 alpha/beta fold hydrolase [Sphingomonas sp. HF-S4]
MTARTLAKAVCAILAILAAGPIKAQSTDPVLEQIQARPRAAPDGRTMEITTGFVSVPERRADAAPRPRQIRLAVVRIRWAGAGQGVANMLLAGGPGDSGTRLLSGLPAARAAALLDLMGGDVVSFDQRGTGRSQPNLALPDPIMLPFEVAGSIEAWLPPIEAAARRARRLFVDSGVNLAAYNSIESADDVDAVRRALGYARISLWGRSYGSHLALATVRRHPEGIARLILVGPEGPDHTLKLPSQTDAVIRRIGERASAPELPDVMRTVLDRLRRRPVLLTVAQPNGAEQRITVGAFDLQRLTAQALGDPRALATLPIAYREMAAGDFSRVGPLLLSSRTWRLGSAMKQMMDVASYASPSRVERIRREAKAALLGSAMNFPTMELHTAWPDADLGADYRMPVRSDVPALILVGDLDARTPVENAREIALGLPNAKVVVIENGAHQFDMFGETAIQPVLRAFLGNRPVTVESIRLPAIPFQR